MRRADWRSLGILPDWFYRAVLDDALVLTIDPAYFSLTSGLERWLYRLVRKHAGRQRTGWRFDLRHLHIKSASLSPFKRFAFELRDIAHRQPLPGYRLIVERETGGRELLAFTRAPLSTGPYGQPVEAHVLSGTEEHVPSGTGPTCYQEPEQPDSSSRSIDSEPPNLDSNIEESNPSVVGDRRNRWKAGRGER